jgi:SAM-dependent methyltransferase
MTTFAHRTEAYRTRLKYTDDRSKAVYIADKYAPILIGSVLDVGCGDASLRKLVHQPFRYIGIDVRPDADRVVDLETQTLPFADRNFDTVVCAAVRVYHHHRDEVFDELFRVARKHVVVSLSAPMEGAGGAWTLERDQAMEFVTSRARKNGFSVEQIDFVEEASQGGTAWCVLRREGK